MRVRPVSTPPSQRSSDEVAPRASAPASTGTSMVGLIRDGMLPPVQTGRSNTLAVPEAPRTDTVKAETHPGAEIPDRGTVSSKVTLDGGVQAEKVRLTLELEHSWPGDLRISLTSPSGESVVLWDRKPGAVGSLNGTFEVPGLSVQPAGGEWTLTVEDLASRDSGVVKAWGLEVEGAVQVVENPDRDPMKHIEYLASQELRGRDSPSEGLDVAAKYIADRLEKYGLKAPNPADPQGGYFQSFDMWKLRGDDALHADDPSRPPEFGHELFQEGYYIDETLLKGSKLNTLRERHQRLQRDAGLLPTDIRSLEDLRRVSVADGRVQNVMGLLEGTGPNKDEVIVVMAHYDHVGEDQWDRINAGADDNASGTAAILAAIPDLVEQQKRGELDRSILFLWTAAEEKGLVGAQYFVDHPIPGIGLEEISGVVNVDMVGRWDDERLSVIDKTRGQPNYLRDVLEHSNQQLEDPFDRLNRDIDAYTNRQDGAVFAKAGEDVLFLFEGLSNPNGGGKIQPDYHLPTDTVDKIYKDNGGEKPRRVRDLVVKLLGNAANRVVEPKAESLDWK